MIDSQIGIRNYSGIVRFVGLALALIIPSLGTVHKYGGTIGILLYSLFVPVGLWLQENYISKWFLTRVSERAAAWLVVVTFLSITAMFLTIYPIANSGVVGGGSDTDEALDVAASELFHGRYPFYAKTYLDNPIAPLPGAIFFSVPFVLLGRSAYQNLFWLGAFFILAKRLLKDLKLALLLLWTILGLSPVLILNIVTGTDELSNSLYVLIIGVALAFWTSAIGRDPWKRSGIAVAMGIALSSRSNFAFLLPLLITGVARRAGWHAALRDCAVVIVSFLLCTLPFWVYDPGGFSPLYTQFSKLSQFNRVLPFSGLLISSLTGLVAVAMAYTYIHSDVSKLLRNSALILFVPILCTTMLSMSTKGMAGLV